MNTGNLGPFANGYWGHSAYVMSPEENLLVTAHYLEALKKQATAAKMMAILGGKNPHPQSTVGGGVTCGGELSADRLNSFRAYLEETRKFVNTVYIPDLKAVAARYPEWTTAKAGSKLPGMMVKPWRWVSWPVFSWAMAWASGNRQSRPTIPP